MQIDAIITTSANQQELAQEAHKIALELNITYVPRQHYSIAKLREITGIDNILVLELNRLIINMPGGKYFFHPNMAKLRINELQKEKEDIMIKVLNLQPSDSVLDCTMGIGSDAVLISYCVPEGKVVALESNPLMAKANTYGVAHYVDPEPHVTEAIRRIEVVHADYNDFLAKCPDQSFDIVYLDPMFRKPKLQSVSLNPLRELANHEPLSDQALSNARRVARKLVVFKEASGSTEFERLGCERVGGGKYSPVAYGLWSTGIGITELETTQTPIGGIPK